jgi:PAS domain S-box-containing protein
VLTVSVIATVAVALCFQAWMLYEGRVRALAMVRLRAANRAQATAHGVYGLIRETDLTLRAARDELETIGALSELPDARKERTDIAREVLLRNLSRTSHIVRIHVTNADGKYVYSSVAPVPDVSIADREYFREQKMATSDEIKISDVNFGKSSNRWGLYATRRLTLRDGRFLGIIFAVLEPESLANEMTAVDRAQWILALFDRKNRLVASNRMLGHWTGRRFDDPVILLGMNENRSQFHGRAFGQPEPYVWASEKVQGLPLLTLAGYSERLALVQWHRDLRVNLIVSAVLIFGCLLILNTQGRIQRSASDLSNVNERMKLAATSVQLGVWECDISTDTLTWDDEMRRLYQLSADTVIKNKQDWLGWVFPEEREKLSLLLETPSTLRFEERISIRTVRGELRHMRVAGVVQTDSIGRPRRIVGINWDVTHLERAQHEIQASEAYFRTLFDAVPNAVVVVESGKVVDDNRPYRDLFLIGSEEKRPPWLLSPEHQSDGSTSMEAGLRLVERIRRGQVERSLWTCLRADGKQFEAEITAKLFLHEGRELVVTTVRDLTEQRKLEDQLHQAQKLDALGQLAGGVAHDFNNMLTAILASAEMMTPDEPESVRNELRATIVSAAERAAQLTGKLLAFARKGKIRSIPTDVHQVIDDTVALLERTVDRKILLITALNAKSKTVLGDVSQLQSALLNLGVNARDAMPDGGTIEFRSSNVEVTSADAQLGAFTVTPGEYIRISVSDVGAGINAEDLKHIFDPFFTTKEVGKGTGLGLAAVFGTMASHKGAVTVYSELGKGTCFSLFLPVTTENVSVSTEIDKNVPTGSGVILVVDDEDLVRTATTLQVESLGYVVLSERDPVVAIETFKKNHAKLSAVLLDMVMPRLSGLDVLVRLREFDASIPVILMSGFTRTEQLDQTTGRAIAGFLQKPFSSGDLRKLLSEVCVVRVQNSEPPIPAKT